MLTSYRRTRPSGQGITSYAARPMLRGQEERHVIIVAGKLYVAAEERHAYLTDCLEIIQLARAAPGCLDFQLAADPLEADRINVYEAWKSVEALEAFRGSGPSSSQAAQIRSAQVSQYEVVSPIGL